MKKTFFANIFAVVGIMLSSNPIAIAAGHVSHGHSNGADDNLIGYLHLDGNDVKPLGISEKEDGTLIVTAAGKISQDSQNSGQIWEIKGGSGGRSFSQQEIVLDPDKDHRIFISNAYSTRRGSLFVCSVPNTNNISDSIAPAVIEFRKNTDGQYQWISVMNFSPELGQTCKGLNVIDGRLFAVNSFYNGDPSFPAVYSADISQENLPADMSVVQTYSDLGFFQNEPLSSLGRKWPIALPDIVPAKEQSDGMYSLFILDSDHNQIDAINFIEDSGSLVRASTIRELKFGTEVSAATAMANVDDTTFIVAAGDGSDNACTEASASSKCSGASIYRITYGDEGSSPGISMIASPYAPVASLMISSDRVNPDSGEQVLFAPIAGRDRDGKYNVAEYRYL